MGWSGAAGAAGGIAKAGERVAEGTTAAARTGGGGGILGALGMDKATLAAQRADFAEYASRTYKHVEPSARDVGEVALMGGAALAGGALADVAAALAGHPEFDPLGVLDWYFEDDADTLGGGFNPGPEAERIRKQYFPEGQTPAQKAEAGQRLVNDALNREREWEGSHIQLKHPDWTEKQVAEEWVRFFLGPDAARHFRYKPPG